MLKPSCGRFPPCPPIAPTNAVMPKKFICGSVAARPADEAHAELAEACRQGRAVVAAPIPAPVSGSPTSFRLVQRPPQPPSTPTLPLEAGDDPAKKADERRAAAGRRAIAEENDQRGAAERFGPFLTVAAKSATTPREGEDPFDIRRWRRWSPEWDQ